VCGDERTRTADPLLAKQVLYQLSYVPSSTCDDTASVRRPRVSEAPSGAGGKRHHLTSGRMATSVPTSIVLVNGSSIDRGDGGGPRSHTEFLEGALKM
jgi:hypothetical protein